MHTSTLKTRAFLAILPTLLIATNAQQLTLPYQLGAYPVSSTDHELRTTRPDLLAPNPEGESRRLMLSIYRPLTELTSCPQPITVPYMLPRIASIFETQLLPLFNITGTTLSRLSSAYCPAAPTSSPNPLYSFLSNGNGTTNAEHLAPIILLSHGLGTSRLMHQTLGPALASSGLFTVIAIDHTYDAWGVEFPDGTISQNTVLPNVESIPPDEFQAYNERNADVRAADVTSVLDAIEKGDIVGLEAYGGDNYGSGGGGSRVRAGVVGHSLGGSTASIAVIEDARVLGGINMDGQALGVALTVTTAKPFAMVAGDHSDIPENEALLNEVFGNHYARLQGFRRWLRIAGTRHLSFCDVQLAVDVLGIRNNTSAAVVGTMEGKRLLEIEYTFFRDFFDMVLNGADDAGVMEAPSGEFEDVEFVRADE